MSRSRRLWFAALALAVAPLLWNAWSAARDGWTPEGDGATITLRTHDVFTTHPPTLGNPTNAGRAELANAYHPGPLEFYALAVPLRLLGADGMLYGTATVAAISVVGIGALGRRVGGSTMGLALLSTAAVLAWSLGDEVLHDPYNPNVVLLPLALLLTALWATLSGDAVGLPIAVVAASWVAQGHVLYAYPAAVAAVAVVVACVVRARPSRRVVLLSAALALALWAPPILHELGSGPSNLAALWRAGRTSDPLAGPRYAWARATDTLVEGAWLERDPSALRLLGQPAGWIQLACAAAVGLLGLAGWRAHRADRPTTAALVAAALVALLGSLVTAARTPTGLGIIEIHGHLHWWITGALVWFAAAWCLADLARERLAKVPRLVAGVPLVVAAGLITWTPTIDDDRGSASFGAIPALADATAAALPRVPGPWLVRAEGPQAFFSVEAGLVTGLVLRGVDAGVSEGEGPIYGAAHVVDEADAAGTIVVASDDHPPAVPDGFTLVARYDAAADAEGTGHRNAGVFGQPQQLAVFLRVSASGG